MEKKKQVPIVVPGTQAVLMSDQREDGRGNNDFCLWQDDSGLWHLFSITWYNTPTTDKPRCWLSHATAHHFLGPWERQPYLLLSPTNNWAPHIVRDPKDPGKVLMFLGGMSHDTLRAYESKSGDLFNWTLRQDFGQLYGTRDPMLLYVPEEERWYMYTTYTTQKNGNVGVAVNASDDLVHWELTHMLYCLPGETVDESPFVVHKDGCYYLWTTSSSRSFLIGIPTRVFRSEYPDFHDIPDTGKANCLLEIPLHAIEVQSDGDQDYICQTGTGGPGIVANRLRWGVDGPAQEVDFQAFEKTGTWHHDGATHFTGEPGAGVQYTFTGRRVAVSGDRSMRGGVAEILLDGVSCGKFDFFGCDAEAFWAQYPNAFLWTSEDLPQGRHTIQVIATGEKQASAADSFIFVNKLIITQ